MALWPYGPILLHLHISTPEHIPFYSYGAQPLPAVILMNNLYVFAATVLCQSMFLCVVHVQLIEEFRESFGVTVSHWATLLSKAKWRGLKLWGVVIFIHTAFTNNIWWPRRSRRLGCFWAMHWSGRRQRRPIKRSLFCGVTTIGDWAPPTWL